MMEMFWLLFLRVTTQMYAIIKHIKLNILHLCILLYINNAIFKKGMGIIPSRKPFLACPGWI